MRHVLVTGGAGFIGANFVRYLLEADRQLRVINLDALTYAGSRENLRDLPDPARHVFVHGNICNRELVDALLAEHRIDTIVHFAAESHVDRSIRSADAFIETNVRGTCVLLEAARRAWRDRRPPMPDVRFHHVSTDEVYGSLAPDDPPFCETTAYAPNSPYAASKAASDHLVRAYAHTHGLPCTISNCSNNYGPFQFPEKLIPLTLFNALRGKPLPIYGDGKQVRDWLYVADHCEAMMRILCDGRVGQTYNIGGNNQPANLELVRELCVALDERFPDSPHRPHDQLIQFVNDRPGHDRRYAIDTRKTESELGWRPRHTLAEGLRKTIDWYLAHESWLTAISKQLDYQDWIAQNYAARG